MSLIWNRLSDGAEIYVGMRLLEDHSEKGYLLMGLNLEHHPNENSQWVLEECPGEMWPQLLNRAARPYCVLHDKQEFAEYHSYLKSQGIVVWRFWDIRLSTVFRGFTFTIKMATVSMSIVIK